MSYEHRKNIETMESEEIINRIYKNYFSEEVKKTAIDILKERNVDVKNTLNQLQLIDIKKKVEEKNNYDDFKDFWKKSWLAVFNVVLLAFIITSILLELIEAFLKNRLTPSVTFLIFCLSVIPAKKIIDSSLKNKTIKEIKTRTIISFTLFVFILSIPFFVFGN